MSAFVFALNAAGRPAILAQGPSHQPPAAVRIEGGRLLAVVAANAHTNLGAVNRAGRDAMGDRDTIDFFTIDAAGQLVGESTVPILR